MEMERRWRRRRRNGGAVNPSIPALPGLQRAHRKLWPAATIAVRGQKAREERTTSISEPKICSSSCPSCSRNPAAVDRGCAMRKALGLDAACGRRRGGRWGVPAGPTLAVCCCCAITGCMMHGRTKDKLHTAMPNQTHPPKASALVGTLPLPPSLPPCLPNKSVTAAALHPSQPVNLSHLRQVAAEQAGPHPVTLHHPAVAGRHLAARTSVDGGWPQLAASKHHASVLRLPANPSPTPCLPASRSQTPSSPGLQGAEEHMRRRGETETAAEARHMPCLAAAAHIHPPIHPPTQHNPARTAHQPAIPSAS